MAQFKPNTLQDITNKKYTERKTSISDVLKLPPAPRRSGKHRNYAKKFYPVLTAEERLEEIRQIERAKQENEVKKLARAAERAENKQRKEKAKEERAKQREQKRLETEAKQHGKENHIIKKRKKENDQKHTKKTKLSQ